MTRSHKLLLAVCVVAAGATMLIARRLVTPEPPSALAGSGLAPPADPGPASPARRAPEREAPIVLKPTGPEARATTVTSPLRLELELLRARGRLAAEGAAPRGSGARARLRGGLYGSDQEGIPGEIRFVAGANAGRVLQCDSSGAFGANDLYPGLSIVEGRAPGVPPVMRELRLRNERESLLNVGFGRPATIYGEVIDLEGKPIEGAEVTIDGQGVRTDDKGVFYVPRMASGEALAIVQKPGYASYREKLNVMAAHTVPIGKIRFALEPAASLEVVVQERVGAPGPALLFLEPDGDFTSPGVLVQRKFPWHVVSPASVAPGGTVLIEDLPAMRVRLRLFHSGAVARPPVVTADLTAGRRTQVVLHLEPAPMLRGKVTRAGAPVRGALVRLELPDQAQATADVLGTPLALLEAEVRPNLPPAVQTATTDSAGEFHFSAAEELGSVRYLTAEDPDGKGWAGRVVHAGERVVELELSDEPVGVASLRVESLPRTQPLPVEVRVNGAPLDLPLVPPEDSLHVPGLAPGVWKVRASWGAETLLRDVELHIDGDAELFLPLPDEARNGPAAAPGGR